MTSASEPSLVIGTAVPSRLRAPLWGDTYFAQDLATAMSRLGWHTSIRTRAELARLRPGQAEAVIYLRGVAAAPKMPVPHVLWMISHPADLDAAEVTSATHFFSASAELAAGHDGTHLAQATDINRFHPTRASDAPGAGRVLFVGNSRGQRRKAVHFAIQSGVDVAVYGRKWRQVVPNLEVSGRRIDNDKLAASYSAAHVVLNDHWDDMAAAGIVSNRIFDALACGAQVVTDAVREMPAELAEHVHVFTNLEEFTAALRAVDELDADERRERSVAARAFVENAHTFDHRAAVLDAVLREQL